QNGETATFSYKAWDQTSGTASTNATPSYASTASSGGTGAFSSNDASAQIIVSSLNDAPTITNGHTYTLTGVNEDTTSAGALASAILSSASLADVDNAALSGLAITGKTGGGNWQFSTDGISWTNIGTVSSSTALVITSSTQVRYVPRHNGETATLSYRAWDQTSGTASTNGNQVWASIGGTGGTTAFSAASATVQIVVTSVNDAPTITSGHTYSLTDTNEDTTTSATLASAILTGASLADVDTGALSGMAVTAVTGNGTWQYSTDGTTWAAFGSVSSTNALLITSSTQVRYVPNGTSGETATFSYTAWDQTSGTASTNATPSYSSTASSGGTTAFSTNTASAQIVVSSVNDTPTAVADTASAIEAGGISNSTAGTNPTGDVLTNDTDVDAGVTKTVTGVAAGVVGSATTDVGSAVAGIYGSINIAANGAYTYTVDNSNAAVQALRTTANTLQDIFTYT
ncbi:MAG: beta strand repeat-containing protein, partial [Pirellula sp.]